MKEILETIPLWLEIKDIVNQIIDWIPLFALTAAITALYDIPGTVRAIGKVTNKIVEIIEWILTGKY